MGMTKSIAHGLMLASFAAMTVASTPAAAQEKKPNVVFMLADNVGYGASDPTAGASCAALRRHASTSLLAKDFD